jgi:hypothetical protein
MMSANGVRHYRHYAYKLTFAEHRQAKGDYNPVKARRKGHFLYLERR